MHQHSVQFTQLCPTLYDSLDCSSPGFPVHHQLLELTQTHVHQVGDAIQPSHPLLPTTPLALFSSESALHIRWPKYWSFCFSNSHPNEYSGLISFRIDWFDLLAVQGTLKRLLQHRNSKVSILRCSVFFLVQLSHPDYVQNIQIGQGRSKECLYRSWLLSLPLRQELKAKFLAWSLGPSLGCRPHKLRWGSLFRSLITLQCLE